MTKYVFPENALSLQQTYLSNLARKPSDMSWRQYDVKLHQENKNLALYPPNFNVEQCLPDAVLLGMVHRTAPNYFKEQVKSQGFDIQTKSTKELIEFFETRCEPVYRARLAAQKRKQQSTTTTTSTKKKTKRAAKWCTHCKNNTHNTSECGYLIRQRAAKQKEQHRNSKTNFFKSKKMSKEEIKEFHEFNKAYNKWQTHKKYKNDHHNVERDESAAEDDYAGSEGDISPEEIEVTINDDDVNELDDDESTTLSPLWIRPTESTMPEATNSII